MEIDEGWRKEHIVNDILLLHGKIFSTEWLTDWLADKINVCAKSVKGTANPNAFSHLSQNL